jgi:hypothetical protein
MLFWAEFIAKAGEGSDCTGWCHGPQFHFPDLEKIKMVLNSRKL